MEDADALSAPNAALVARSRVLQAVRGFFIEAGFLEVETPVRIPAPCLEPYIGGERR